MSGPTHTRTGTMVIFAAPLVLAAGLIAHPFVGSYLDPSNVAGAVDGAPDRWLLSHLVIVVGLALLLVAATVIRYGFRLAGEQRWSSVAVPLLVAGGTLLAALAGSEVTLAAVAATGQDVHAVLMAVETAAGSLYLGGAALFTFGWLCIGVALHRTPLLTRPQTWVANTALAVTAIGLFVPHTTGPYAYGLALIAVHWLIGYRLVARHPVGSVTDSPAISRSQSRRTREVP